MSLSLPFLGISLSRARRLISALRTIPILLREVVKSEKSNSFLNIRVLTVFTLKTAIYRRPEVNLYIVISTIALSSIMPYTL